MTDRQVVGVWLGLLGAACWVVCFWWMHRISTRQDALLEELRQQGARIEKLSKEEHDLIKEVHPAVGEMQEQIKEIGSIVDQPK